MLITHCPACHASLTVSQITVDISAAVTDGQWSEPDLPNELAFALSRVSTRRGAVRDALIDFCWSRPWGGHLPPSDIHSRFIQWANLRSGAVSKTMLSSVLIDLGGRYVKMAAGREYYCPSDDALPPRGRRFRPLQYVDRHGEPLPDDAVPAPSAIDSQPDPAGAVPISPGDVVANQVSAPDPEWDAVAQAAGAAVSDPGAHAEWCDGVGEHQPGASPCYRIRGAGDGCSAQVPIDADAPPLSLPARASFIDMTDGPDFTDDAQPDDGQDDLPPDLAGRVGAPAGADASIDYSVTAVPADAPGLPGDRYAMPLPDDLADQPFGVLEAYFADHLPGEYLMAGPVAIRAEGSAGPGSPAVNMLHAPVHRVDGGAPGADVVAVPADDAVVVHQEAAVGSGTTTWLDGPPPADGAGEFRRPAEPVLRWDEGAVVAISGLADKGAPGALPEWRIVVRVSEDCRADDEFRLTPDQATELMDAALPGHYRRLGAVAVRPETIASSGMWVVTAAFTDRPLQPAAQPAPAQEWQPMTPEMVAQVPDPIEALQGGHGAVYGPVVQTGGGREAALARHQAALDEAAAAAPSTDVDDAGDAAPADDGDGILEERISGPDSEGQLGATWLLDGRWGTGTAPLDADALVGQLLAGRDLGEVTAARARRSTIAGEKRVRVQATIMEAVADVASPLIMAGQDDAGQPTDAEVASFVARALAPVDDAPALAQDAVVQPDVASGILDDPELEAQVDAARQAFLAGQDPVPAGDPSIDAGLAADAAADALADVGRAPVPGGPADVLARRRAAAQEAAPVRSWVSDPSQALDAGDWG